MTRTAYRAIDYPPGAAGERFDLVLNEGVINVDEPELNVEVTKSNGCEGDEAVQTGIDDLRFGFPCTLVEMTYDHLNEPTIEEGS